MGQVPCALSDNTKKLTIRRDPIDASPQYLNDASRFFAEVAPFLSRIGAYRYSVDNHAGTCEKHFRVFKHR